MQVCESLAPARAHTNTYSSSVLLCAERSQVEITRGTISRVILLHVIIVLLNKCRGRIYNYTIFYLIFKAFNKEYFGKRNV